MGRWAQRTRGSGNPTLLNSMQLASIQGSGHDIVEVAYAYAIEASKLAAADFTSNPSSEVPSTVSQLSVNVVSLQFGVDLTGDTDLTYSGAYVKVQHPQTINY